jgi:hypothetical protein
MVEWFDDLALGMRFKSSEKVIKREESLYTHSLQSPSFRFGRFTAPPMTFEVNGRQFIAITSGPSAVSKAKLVNTPELKEMRNATVLYVFAL